MFFSLLFDIIIFLISFCNFFFFVVKKVPSFVVFLWHVPLQTGVFQHHHIFENKKGRIVFKKIDLFAQVILNKAKNLN